MTTGLPVVVGAVGGIPELIEEGQTSFLVTPNDERILAEKLGSTDRRPGPPPAGGQRRPQDARGEPTT
jgi:glycosyltransferase involved in cell wall biosynthesis